LDARAHFTRFVGETSEQLFRTAYLLSGDLADAEELLQDVLVHLYPKWNKVVAADYPIAYVRRSLINRFMTSRRGPGRLKSPFGAFGNSAIESDDLAQLLDRAEIADLLASTSPKQRAAIVLRYFDDLPDGDIASVLGCRVATVRSLVSRGLLAMRARAAASNTDEIMRFPHV
jgi:RNA polymerase sigma-70 factor (sigma-E family)